MNPIKVFPIILLLLISLSITSYAVYCPATGGPTDCAYVQFTQLSHSAGTMQMHVFINQTGHASYDSWYSGDIANITMSDSFFKNGSNDISFITGTFTIYCSGGPNGRDLCYGNKVVSLGSYLACNNTDFKAYQAGGTKDSECTTYLGGSGYSAIGYPTSGSLFYISSIGNTHVIGHVGRTTCLLNVIAADSGYYWLNRDDLACYECYPSGLIACASNTTYASKKCINHVWQAYQTCEQGGYSPCLLANSSLCPSVTPPSYQFNYTQCTNNSQCLSTQVCGCGSSTNISGIPNVILCSTVNETGFCRNKPSNQCTDDVECEYSYCINKDSTGVGTCAYPCTSTNNAFDGDTFSSCAWGTTCAYPPSIDNSTASPWYDSYGSMRGMYYEKICLSSLGRLCDNNDVCYSENCKAGCSGDSKRCVVPTYSCYCSSSADCTGTTTACVTQTTTQPTYLTIGKQVCIAGFATGQSCSSYSQCGSGNCQNGVCCASGSLCCNSDSQCNSEQVCFTNANWAAYNYYYTCKYKLGAGEYCQENKECITSPCSGNFCSGTLYATTSYYTTSPSSYSSLPQYSILNMTLNYKIQGGNNVPEPTVCNFYNESSTTIIASGSCLSGFTINLTNLGTNKFRVTASKSGYETQYAGYIITNVYPIGSLKGNGQKCSVSSECTSGRCDTYVGAGGTNTYITCTSNSQCSDNECLGLEYKQITPTCISNSQCTNIFGSAYTCDALTGSCRKDGLCIASTTIYHICCANDGSACCDPYSYLPETQRCTYYNTMCNPSTATCSIQLIPLGQECNLSAMDTCASGGTCIETQTNASKGVCCIGSKQTGGVANYCCNQASDCFTTDGNLCNSYRCELKTTMAFQQCSNDGMCDVIHGYGCLPANGLSSVGIVDGTYICQAYPCGIGLTPCSFCRIGNTTVSAEQCSNATRSITCALSDTACIMSGGIIPSQPPATTTLAPGAVNPEFLFQQLINLAFYTFIVAILFMVIALVVAGFTLAYSLIKR